MLGKAICISCKLLCRQARKFLLQRVGDMFAYRLYIAPEQLRHLMAVQPYRLVLEVDVQPDGFVRLVDDNLVLAQAAANPILGDWHSRCI